MRKVLALLFLCAASAASAASGYRPVLLDFAKSSVITVPGYKAAETITNFPLLVRISSELIPGFAYSDLKSSDGRGIAFMDLSGNLLNHEIDTWEASGESLVWVKVPELTADTHIRFCWGNDDLSYDPGAKEVWADYIGVWHLGEAGDGQQDIFDATANGLDGFSHANTAATAAGKIGGSRAMCVDQTGSGGVQIPYGSALDVQDFTVSYWERRAAKPAWRSMVSRCATQWVDGWLIRWTSDGDGGWMGAYMEQGVSAGSGFIGGVAENVWDQYAFVFCNTNVTVCRAGVQKAVWRAKAPASNGQVGLALGVDPPELAKAKDIFSTATAFRGDMDEVRIFRGAMSVTRIKAEYDNENTAAFLAYGAVEPRAEDAPALEMPVLSRDENGNYVLSVSVSGKAKTVTAVYGGTVEHVLGTDVEGPVTLTDDPIILETGTDYSVKVVATDADGNAVSRTSGDTILMGAVSVSAGASARGLGLRSGSFTVSRPAGADNEDLVVSYEVAGATAGADYEALSGKVTIPAGQQSAQVAVKPLANVAKTLTVTLVENKTGTMYEVGTASAEIALEPYEAGENKWIAAADGNASEAGNWSLGRVPREGDTVILDGTSVKAMTWDAGVNGLPAAVAAWRQDSGYTGTVTFPTTYPTYSADFAVFTVYGDVTLNGGVWTHPANDDTEAWRLRVDIGRDLWIGANGKINCELKGYAAGKFHPGSRLGVHAGSHADRSHVYGNFREPVDLGSGGVGTAKKSGAGGGAIYLTVAGTVYNEGRISAGASTAAYGGITSHTDDSKGGAGGSVFIRAGAVTRNGKTTGRIIASGSHCANAEGGSGGRIAVVLTRQRNPPDFVYSGSTFYCDASSTGGGIMKNPGCGTVFVQTAGMPNGFLYMYDTLNDNGYCNLYIDTPPVCGGCCVPPGEAWMLDGIVFGGRGSILAIPSGATLNLPNGWRSVTAGTSSYSSDHGGISYQGGTLNVAPGDSGVSYFTYDWSFEALEPYTIEGDVIVRRAGSIGTLSHAAVSNCYPISQITVNGNLDVQGTPTATDRGRVSTMKAGLSKEDAFKGHRSSHGGQLAALRDCVTYGSVFNPDTPGCFSSATYPTHGSGALKLTVTGTLNVNGTIDADAAPGQYNNWNPDAAGGSLDITCGRLTGTGLISANGNRAGTPSPNTGYHKKDAGAAGRVAVRLTDEGATFDDFGVENIQARGWHGGAAVILDIVQSNYYVSAGTVYLQDAATDEKSGTVYIRDMEDPDGVNTYSFTPFPSVSFGGEREDFSAASLDISSYARVKASRAFTAKSLAISDSATLDLNGRKISLQACSVNDVALEPGVYTAARLQAMGLAAVKDTSETGRGRLRVGDLGLMLIFR